MIARHHAWLSLYHWIVDLIAVSNRCFGHHPSSVWIFVASIAYRRSWPGRRVRRSLGNASFGDPFWRELGRLSLLVLVAFAIASVWTGRAVDRWAARRRYRLLWRERHWYSKGPFSWRNGPAYRVAVQVPSGEYLEGWVRTGSDRVEVRWDPPPAEQIGGVGHGFPVVLQSQVTTIGDESPADDGPGKGLL